MGPIFPHSLAPVAFFSFRVQCAHCSLSSGGPTSHLITDTSRYSVFASPWCLLRLASEISFSCLVLNHPVTFCSIGTQTNHGLEVHTGTSAPSLSICALTKAAGGAIMFTLLLLLLLVSSSTYAEAQIGRQLVSGNAFRIRTDHSRRDVVYLSAESGRNEDVSSSASDLSVSATPSSSSPATQSTVTPAATDRSITSDLTSDTNPKSSSESSASSSPSNCDGRCKNGETLPDSACPSLLGSRGECCGYDPVSYSCLSFIHLLRRSADVVAFVLLVKSLKNSTNA